MVLRIYLVLVFLLISACSGVKLLSEQEIYTPAFLKQMESIQFIYKDGDKLEALKKLQELDDAILNPDERAKKYNHIGVIFFSQLDYLQAITYFEIAKEHVEKDLNLNSQIDLNLASSYFKRNEFDLSKNILSRIKVEYFEDSEKEKYYKLKLSLSHNENNSLEVSDALIFLGYKLDSLSEVNKYQYKDFLLDHFNNLSFLEKGSLFEKHEKNSKFLIIYLVQREIGQLYFSGKKDEARDLMDWLASTYSNEAEVEAFISDFQNKMKSFSKINTNAVGVIVPLSGDKKRFGRQVLTGVNTALKNQSQIQREDEINIYIKDNQGHDFLSAKLVEELILEKQVSVIIGGVFPDLAKKEYLEARKYGVYFISLSPVNLPRSQKNHLLLEIPGSIESQIEKISSDEFKNYFGSKLGLLYQESETGHAYLNEIWSKSLNEKLELKNLNKYEKGVKEYLTPVKKLLNLSYPRERREERELWKDIYSVNKRQVRIINYLKPSIDFDWVYIPSYPHEAVQIIPTFQYYDANNLTFIGGPSWSSRKLVSQKPARAKLFYVGDNPEEFNQQYIESFKTIHGRGPNYLETLSSEGLILTKNILGQNLFDKREKFERYILDLTEVKGMTSKWNMQEGIWLKDLDVMAITSRGISKLNLTRAEESI